MTYAVAWVGGKSLCLHGGRRRWAPVVIGIGAPRGPERCNRADSVGGAAVSM